MDVYRPKSGANGAAAIVAMSGGWVSDHDRINIFYVPFINGFVNRGYTVFAVHHGSQPKFTVPEAVADINRAVRFIRLHAKDYGVDPDRFGISGGSAGGHLSLMQGTAGDLGDARAKDEAERVSSRVQAVACLYPPTDFLNYGGKDRNAFAPDGVLAGFRTAVDVRELDPITKMLERIPDARHREMLRKISPITHVSADDPPTLIIHGDKDFLVPIQQAETFVAKLKEAGVAAELIVRPGAGHGWLNQEKDVAMMADWFDKHLKKK
jgi:acetyl esterase/lipase